MIIDLNKYRFAKNMRDKLEAAKKVEPYHLFKFVYKHEGKEYAAPFKAASRKDAEDLKRAILQTLRVEEGTYPSKSNKDI